MNNTVEHEDDVAVSEALTVKRFWYLAAMLFLGTFYGCYVVSVYKTVANVNLEDHLLTLAGSLGSACNGSSRIIWATLQDNFGFRRVYSCLLTL